MVIVKLNMIMYVVENNAIYFFKGRVSLGRPNWPWAHYIEQTSIELTEIHLSLSSQHRVIKFFKAWYLLLFLPPLCVPQHLS